MRYSIAGTMVIVLVGGIALAQEPVPLSGEFQINTYTTQQQYMAAVAADDAGNFVVAWASLGSYGTDTSQRSIQARRFDTSGNPKGNQFQVNTYTTDAQWDPDIAVDAQGAFVVAWTAWAGSFGTDSFRSIQGQRYDASGTPVESEFQVNSFISDIQWLPALASRGQGDFVVTWSSRGSYGTDRSYFSIQGQRFDADGIPSGVQFQINSYTTSHQHRPAVDSDAQGNFVVVWDSNGSFGGDTSGGSVQGQRYDSSGTPVENEFQVNSFTTGSQSYPSLAVDPQGNFVVVWESSGSYGTDSDLRSIQAQRFDASGIPLGDQYQVNSYTTGDQFRSKVAVDSLGNFVVVWRSDGSYGDDVGSDSIQGQFYDASGAPVGGQFQVNTYTTGDPNRPAVAVDAQGNFVVVWASPGSYGTDMSNLSIQGQRFASRAVFVDDFESGDTSSWSSTVQ